MSRRNCNDIDRPGHRRFSRLLHSCVLIDVDRPRTSIVGWNQSSHHYTPGAGGAHHSSTSTRTSAMAFAPPLPPSSSRRPSLRQRRPFSRKSQLRPLSHPHPHPLRYSAIPEGASGFNYRMTVASADQLQAQLAQSHPHSHRRRPSVLRRSKQAPKPRPATHQPVRSPPANTSTSTQAPCLHTVTSGVVLTDLPAVAPPTPSPSEQPAGMAAKKRERRRTLSKVRSLIVGLVQRRPSVETYQEEPPINLDSPESFALGAPLRPHRSPDAASFIVSSKITDMTAELKPTRSSSPQRLSVQSGHSLVGGILPSFRRRSLLRERLVSHFSTDSSDDETDDESDAEAALDPAQHELRGSRLRDVKMAEPKAEEKKDCGSVLFGRRFSMPVMPRIKSMPEIVRHPLRRLSFQPRGHSLDRIAI